MMTRWLAVLALVGCTEPLTLGEERDEIIGGTRSTGVTSTMLLASYPPDRSVLATCTAVLVSPTVLLTAAHCVDTPNHPNYIYGVFTGDDASIYPNLAAIEPHLLPVKSVHAHPDYETDFPFRADIGVVVLEQPTSVAEPAPMQLVPLDNSIVGKAAKIVGYGQIEQGEYNDTRYEAETAVVRLDRDMIVVGDGQKHSCLGDSGGPAYVDGTVVGVVSYGPADCSAAGTYRRTDFYKPFIETYVPPAMPTPEPEPMPPGDEDDGEDGGCSTTSGTGSWLSMLAVLGVPGLRRRGLSRVQRVKSSAWPTRSTTR